jgi:hypothetical protein
VRVGTGGFVGQGGQFDLKPLDDSGGDGFFFAEGGERGVTGFAVFFGGEYSAFGGRGLGGLFAQKPFCFGGGVAGFGPAEVQEQAFGAAQVGADGAIAGGLAGLARELRKLAGELFNDVVNTAKVGFGAIQFQFCFVAPLIEAADPGGFLQNSAAGFWFGVDQFADLALTHQCGRMRPGRGVGEQHLDITGADVFGVGFIGGAGVAGDTAHNVQRIKVVEPGRRKAVAIVDGERDFGKVAGRAGGGPGKNHVFHAAAAHGGGAVFAHDPAQGFEQVGFAASVWANNTCQPVRDHQIGRIDKAFEAIEAKAGKAEHCSLGSFKLIENDLRIGTASRKCHCMLGV